MVLLKSPKSFQICVKNLLNHIKPLFLGGVLFSRDGIISPLVFKFHSYPMISIYFPFIFPIYIYIYIYICPIISYIFPMYFPYISKEILWNPIVSICFASRCQPWGNNWPGWRSCEAEDIVAFHPFKNVPRQSPLLFSGWKLSFILDISMDFWSLWYRVNGI